MQILLIYLPVFRLLLTRVCLTQAHVTFCSSFHIFSRDLYGSRIINDNDKANDIYVHKGRIFWNRMCLTSNHTYYLRINPYVVI